MAVTDPDADGESDSPSYYYAGRSGDEWADKTLHADPECPDLLREPVGTMPINGSVVDEHGMEWCPTCAPTRGDYPGVPEAERVGLVDAGRDTYQLRLPEADVRLTFAHVREHESGGFYELTDGDGQVVGTVGDVTGWPTAARRAFEAIDAPPRRTFPR